MTRVVARLISLLSRLVRVRTVKGRPLFIQGRKLVPVSQVVEFSQCGPSGGGGWVWNRPVAIVEELGEGVYRRYPIRHVTLRRLMQLTLLMLASHFLLLVLLRRRPARYAKQ